MIDIYKDCELVFVEGKHEYYLRNIKTKERYKDLISVTNLMTKHGLSVDYGEVPEHIMANARLFGELQHKYFEKYFKGEITKEDLSTISLEGVNILEGNGFAPIANEKRVYNELAAGTIDMLASLNERLAIVDFKFTYNYNIHSITWQLNIYRILLRQNLGIEVDELYCLWYNKQKEAFELREVDILDDLIVIDLFKAELDGKKYIDKQNQLIQRIEKELQIDETFIRFHEAQDFLKKLENDMEAAKTVLLNEMERYGIKSFETPNFKITYIPESNSVSYNNKAIREAAKDFIDIDNYKQETKRKSYLRILDKRKELK